MTDIIKTRLAADPKTPTIYVDDVPVTAPKPFLLIIPRDTTLQTVKYGTHYNKLTETITIYCVTNTPTGCVNLALHTRRQLLGHIPDGYSIIVEDEYQQETPLKDVLAGNTEYSLAVTLKAERTL